MASCATSKSVISSESEVLMHRVMYNWDIKHFDRICTPESEDFEPIASSPFRAGEEIGRESEWELILSAENGYLQVWLYLKKIFHEINFNKDIAVHLIVSVMKADGTQLLRRRCDKNQTFTQEDNGWGMGYIITIESLWDEREVYLEDNTLRLRIQLDLLGDLICKTKHKLYRNLNKRKRSDSPDDSSDSDSESKAVMKKDMRKLLKSQKHSDFTIECDSQQFPVHKIILCARSKVFSAMFKHDTVETRSKTLTIKDMAPQTVEYMLEYLYTGDVKLPDDIEEEIKVLEAADRYQLNALKTKCFRKLVNRLSAENAGRLCVLAYLHNADYEFMEDIRTFCHDNWDSLLKRKSFKDYVISSPRAFLDDLKPPKVEKRDS